jgi:hypothetical protein
MSVKREDGFALPLALSMMVIVAMLAGVTISFATHNTDRATRDALASRALGAADAGVDAALYRMNKALLGSQVQGVFGLTTGVLAETKCLSVELGDITVVDPVAGWCAETTNAEEVDGAAAAGQRWRPASYTYSVSTGVNIGSASAPLIERRVVAVGTAGNVQKRVMATAHASLSATGSLLEVFEQVGYKQCESADPPAGDPAANC